MVIKNEIDAKNQNASSGFCVNVFFHDFIYLTNFTLFSIIFVRPGWLIVSLSLFRSEIAGSSHGVKYFLKDFKSYFCTSGFSWIWKKWEQICISKNQVCWKLEFSFIQKWFLPIVRLGTAVRRVGPGHDDEISNFNH